MPDRMRTVNDCNPVTFQIEAVRSLMVTDYEWATISKAVAALAIVSVVLLIGTKLAFRRLER